MMKTPDNPIVLELKNIRKVYGATSVVEGFSLRVPKGELLCLLGPSGCGKTTTLRMIAGFVKPTDGEIVIRDEVVTYLPPYKRDTGLVFQNYALFPHLTVGENIAFGLKNIGVPKSERSGRIEEVLEMVELQGLAHRFPREMSGGQQQRVGVARALAIRPAVLLLDEPFSNLDAKLRVKMRDDLKVLLQKARITTVFVTHDQEEALAVADRIAVMQQGRVEQIGDSREIYEAPANRFVAEFIGLGNFLSGQVEAVENGNKIVVSISGGIKVAAGRCPSSVQVGDSVTVAVRPEAIRIRVADKHRDDALKGRISGVSYLGSLTRYRVALENESILAQLQSSNQSILPVGQEVYLEWKTDDAIVLT